MTIGEELHDLLTAQVEEHGVPGAAAGILLDGETHTAGVGVTNIEHPLPVDDETLFQVASITKTFTSTAIMLLAEEGLLSLDDPVAKHLPELAAATGLDTDRMTIEHTLSHQAGFDGDHLFVGRVPDTLDDLATARRLFEPGEGFSYNNAAFSIAGAVLEAITDRPFHKIIRDRLLRPLGMTNACFRADDAITHRVAAPHYVSGSARGVLRGTGWQPGWELGPVDRSAGGLIASVSHLLAWARFQLTGAAADGTTLLSAASLDRMHTRVVTADMWTGIGLDWFINHPEGGTTLDHGGLSAGYCSTLVIVPNKDVAVVSLTHATNGASVNQAVRRWALQRFAGIIERDPEPDPTVTIDAAKFTGTFLYPFALLTITAGEKPNTLVVTSSQRDDVDGWKPPPDPPIALAFTTPDHAVSIDAPGPERHVQFGLDDDGTAQWLLWSSRRSPRI